MESVRDRTREFHLTCQVRAVASRFPCPFATLPCDVTGCTLGSR